MDDERVLDEGKTAGSYFHNVIELDGVRVAAGWRKHASKKCDHRSVVYSVSDRRIECQDCNQAVDPFDAFMVITRHFDGMLADVRQQLQASGEAMRTTAHRRAAKTLDKIWAQGMGAHCPHCRQGLLAEDFTERGSSTSREWILAGRRRAAKPPT